MKKFWLLVILFVLFLCYVAFFVYPHQEGVLSSTELSLDDLSKVDPQFQEQFPIQEVDINNQGRSIFIAFVMLTHVLFANLHLGGSWLAVITEGFYLKKKRSATTFSLNQSPFLM